MAKKVKKKIKNMKLEQNELTSTTIGAFENRKSSSFGIFAILSIFILTVIFLPQISAFINGYLNPEASVVVPGGGKKPTINPGEDKEDYSDTFYPLTINLEIARDDITIDDFVISTLSNTLAFKVTNNLDSNIVLNDLNYYLELYDENRVLLERVKVKGNTILAGNSQKYEFNIAKNSASDIMAFTLVKKSLIDYPQVVLKNDTEGVGTLTCTREMEKVTYKFKDNKLKEMQSEIQYLNQYEDYEDVRLKYQNLVISYGVLNGISSTYSDTAEGFTINTLVNLNNATRTTIFNADTFQLDTEPKVVNFEMEAQGFQCSIE